MKLFPQLQGFKVMCCLSNDVEKFTWVTSSAVLALVNTQHMVLQAPRRSALVLLLHSLVHDAASHGTAYTQVRLHRFARQRLDLAKAF